MQEESECKHEIKAEKISSKIFLGGGITKQNHFDVECAREKKKEAI